MTEMEVNELEKEVMAYPVPPEFEINWAKQQLMALKAQEPEIMSLFKFYKAMRDDKQLKQAAENVRELRNKMKVLTVTISELSVQIEKKQSE